MAATVAFPLIGTCIPELAGNAEHFLSEVVQAGEPHWLFHLTIVAARRSSSESRFCPVTVDSLHRLAQALGLPGGFRLQPREFVRGASPRPGRRSEYTLEYPAYFSADSAYLGLAVGLVAAATRRPIPPCVLFSGCLEEPFTAPLRFSLTTRIEEKVLLSFGRQPGYSLRPILDQLYLHPSTRKYLGPRRQRVQPGKVKLFIVPTEVDDDPREFINPLSVQSLPLSVDCFGQADFKDLLHRVDEVAGDDLLLMQVPTAWHALYVLGYHHAHPAILNGLGERLRQQPVRFYRVRHQRADEDVLAGDLESEIQQELAELEWRLAHVRAKDVYARLKIILDQCRKRLRCAMGGIVAITPSADWLRVMARHMPGPESLPHFMPRGLGITARVLQTGKTEVVERTAADADFQAALAAGQELAQRYGYLGRQYEQSVRHVGSCVKVPLTDRGKVLGVICLLREEPGPFNRHMVCLVQALAERAAKEVAAFLQEEERVLGAGTREPKTVEDLVRWTGDLPEEEAHRKLGQDLAQLARDCSGAYRAAVRLLTADGRVLSTIAFSGSESDGPATKQAPTFTLLEEDATAVRAVITGRTFVIPDTQNPPAECRLRPIEPPSRTHAAILLKVGGHTTGVLNVDWSQPGACDPGLQHQLEELANRYAFALRAYQGIGDCQTQTRQAEALAFQLMKTYVEGCSAQDEETRLLVEIGEILVQGLGGKLACVWVADSPGSFYQCRHAWGLETKDVSGIPLAAIEGQWGVNVFTDLDPATDRQLLPLVGTFPRGRHRQLLESVPRLAVLLAAQGQPVALFFLGLRAPIRASKLEQTRQMLNQLAQAFLLRPCPPPQRPPPSPFHIGQIRSGAMAVR